jgi:hypothetical protein
MAMWAAAAIQIVFFGLSHSYQGTTGVIETAISGLVFTLIYLRTRSLWYVIIMHGFWDLFGIVALFLGIGM